MTSDTVDLIYRLHYSGLKGDILVFASSKGQIKSIMKRLKEMELGNAKLYSLYPGLSSKEINKLYTNIDTKRRIIIANDLAETAVSLNNIGAIIDLLLEFRSELTLTGGQRHSLRYITKSKAERRAKRGGITMPTTVYRMMTKSKYDNLPKNLKDEIFRIPTHYTMLEIMEHGLDPFTILDIFPTSQLEYTYNLMIRLGIIDFNNSISEMGKFVQDIPLGIRQASILWRYYNLLKSDEDNRDIFGVILALAMIDDYSSDSYYLYPRRIEEEETKYQYNVRRLDHRDEYFMPLAGKDDVETYLNIWNQLIKDISFSATDEAFRRWCKNNSFNFELLRNVKTLAQNIMEILTLKSGIEISTDNFIVEEILDKPYYLSEIISEIYSDRKFSLNLDKQVVTNYLDSVDNNYTIDSESINTIQEDKSFHIIALIVSRFNTNIGSYNTISCASSAVQ